VKKPHVEVDFIQPFEVAATSGHSGGVHEGQATTGTTPIVTHLQEQGAAVLRHVLARLVAQFDLRRSNSTMRGVIWIFARAD